MLAAFAKLVAAGQLTVDGCYHVEDLSQGQAGDSGGDGGGRWDARLEPGRLATVLDKAGLGRDGYAGGYAGAPAAAARSKVLLQFATVGQTAEFYKELAAELAVIEREVRVAPRFCLV
eukprot:SAG22_NODE_268_length_13300_cov_161.222862_1_plen_118_part_00